MYQPRYMPAAEQDMADLDPPLAKRIYKRIKRLSENFDSIKPEPLAGTWKGKLKFRIGDYRVIYTVNRQEGYLMVHLVRHRREVYEER